jgi:hypothetical protein
MVVHPIFAREKTTALAVEQLAGMQTDNGGWRNDLRFYQTLNAHAHLGIHRRPKNNL